MLAPPIIRSTTRFIPIGNPIIDWSNPLTNGLVALYIPGLHSFDIVGRGAPSNLSRTSTFLSLNNKFGRGGGDKTGTTTGPPSFYAQATLPIKMSSQLSYYFYGIYNGGGGTNDLMGCTYNTAPTSAWSSPFAAWVARLDNGIGTAALYWNSNGTFENSANVAHGYVTGSRISFLVTLRTGGNVILYTSGKSIQSTSTGAGPITYSSTPYFFVGAATTGESANQTCNMAAVWNRELSAKEAFLLDTNPLQLLSFPQDRIWSLIQGSQSTAYAPILARSMSGAPGGSRNFVGL